MTALHQFAFTLFMAKAKSVKSTKVSGALIQQTKDRALARNVARLSQLLSLIKRRMIAIVEGFYDIGEALCEIVDNSLYKVNGHPNLGAFLKAEGLFSIRQATKLIAVVRNVPREQALELGFERSYALVSYTDATPEADSPAQLLREDAKVDGKPVKQASVRDMTKAARGVRDKAKATTKKSAAAREKAKADTALEGALRKGLQAAGLGRAKIEVGASEVRFTIARSAALRFTRGK